MAGITDVAQKLAAEYNITQTSAKDMVIAVMDTIVEFAKKERIQVGRHIFKPTVRKARNGVNPKTGAPMVIGEKQGIKYKYTGDKVKEAKVAPASDTPKKKTAKKK